MMHSQSFVDAGTPAIDDVRQQTAAAHVALDKRRPAAEMVANVAVFSPSWASMRPSYKKWICLSVFNRIWTKFGMLSADTLYRPNVAEGLNARAP